MKTLKYILIILLIVPISVFSQDDTKETEVEDKPERAAFESSFIVDTPTNVLFSKNTLEIQMGHRFGDINGGDNDLAGFWAYSNIRIGLTYGLLDNLTIGFGTTKDNRLQDFNWKAAILRQTRSNSIPVSVSYYGNFVIDGRSKAKIVADPLIGNDIGFLVQHRYSYFNQLIIARRFNSKLSLQMAPSVSHYNIVNKDVMKHDMWAISFAGRYKVSSQTSVIMDYSQPLSSLSRSKPPRAGLSFGLEFATSSHTFQLFATNLFGIVPQKNYMFNQKKTGIFDGGHGNYLIGFNITRNYNF